ncbi:MAG: NAD-dependent epimerase/dehydratase family protein [Thermoplasmatota archaeon]
MRILVTGASGLVGRHVVAALEGHDVFAASRSPAEMDLPDHATAVQWPDELPDVDAVIHLAGASIGGRRWNRAYMDEIRTSRIGSTQTLTQRYGNDVHLISTSAVGYYGRDPDGPCPVDRAPGNDFLAQVCKDWEAAAHAHAGPTTIFRFGHVLAPGDGLLGRLEPLHRWRVAGIIPPGSQFLPWIEAHDLAAQLVHAATSGAEGTYNANVGNVAVADLHRALCARIGGIRWMPVPRLALRLALGPFAPYLMGGQEAVSRLPEGGPTPDWTDLESYLDHVYS